MAARPEKLSAAEAKRSQETDTSNIKLHTHTKQFHQQREELCFYHSLLLCVSETHKYTEMHAHLKLFLYLSIIKRLLSLPEPPRGSSSVYNDCIQLQWSLHINLFVYGQNTACFSKIPLHLYSWDHYSHLIRPSVLISWSTSSRLSNITFLWMMMMDEVLYFIL